MVCAAKVFKVHKSVVCTQSKFFATACKSGFKVSKSSDGCRLPTNEQSIQEGNTGNIELKEEDEVHMKAMIEYLYTFNYKEAENELGRDCDDNDESHAHSFKDPECVLRVFALHIAMHVLGDKYDINSLRVYACSRLKTYLRHEFSITHESDMMIMDHAYHHSRPSDELRQIVIEYIVEQVNRERADGCNGISTAKNFYSIINEMPDVSEALIRCLMDRSTENKPCNNKRRKV